MKDPLRWLEIAVQVVTLVLALGVIPLIRWVAQVRRNELKHLVDSVDKVRGQEVKHIVEGIDRMSKDVARVVQRLEEHIQYHLDKKL